MLFSLVFLPFLVCLSNSCKMIIGHHWSSLHWSFLRYTVHILNLIIHHLHCLSIVFMYLLQYWSYWNTKFLHLFLWVFDGGDFEFSSICYYEFSAQCIFVVGAQSMLVGGMNDWRELVPRFPLPYCMSSWGSISVPNMVGRNSTFSLSCVYLKWPACLCRTPNDAFELFHLLHCLICHHDGRMLYLDITKDRMVEKHRIFPFIKKSAQWVWVGKFSIPQMLTEHLVYACAGDSAWN